MGRLLTVPQTSFARGELNLNLKSRFDTEHYFAGAEKMRNVQVLPHGGFIQRPGLRFIEEACKVLTRITSGVTISTPNGGTGANANDADSSTELVTTTGVSTTDPYVIVHYDLGSAKSVKFADARGLRLSTSGVTLSQECRIQYSTDDAAWNDLGSAFDAVAEDDVTRRRSNSGSAISARYWRVVRVGSTDASTRVFHLDELWLWEESATLSAMRKIAFAFSTTQKYMFVATDQNLRVFKNDEDDKSYLADIYMPHTTAQLSGINWVQSLETLIIFHQDVQPHEVQRRGASDEWFDAALTLSNIPDYDFGSGNEDIWSATRGWPACGTFHEGRSYMGGSASLPSTFAASKAGSLFDFDNSASDDDYGFMVTLDTDQVEAIRNIRSGRHLQVFTSSGEFYVLPHDDPITPSTVNAKRTSEIGSLGPGIRTVSVEGATLFIQRLGGSLREFLYTDLEQAYQAQDISLLSSHLMRNPVDLAVRRASSTEQGDLVYVINGDDGTVAVLTTLRSQKITGWTLWETDGTILSVGADDGGTWVGVERSINGATVRYIEVFDYAYETDCAIKYTSGLPTDTFAVAHLEAASVAVYADDAVLSNETVASGSVTIDRDAETEVEIGLPWPDQDGNGGWLWVKDMPLELQLPEGSPIGRKKRIVNVILRVQDTQALYVGANGRAPRPVLFRQFGSGLLDQPPPAFTGKKLIEGLLGFDLEGQIEISKRSPGHLHVDSASKRVSV